MTRVDSGTPVFLTDADGRISEWNDAAAHLTGIPAAAVVGRACWDVVRGRDDAGAPVCHRDCVVARRARLGAAVQCADLWMPTPAGTKPLALSTIAVRTGEETLVLHPMRERAAQRRRSTEAEVDLTRRQREILQMLADGLRVREIAHNLTISERTVRNHIHALLVELDAHSQLEAVARARRLELVSNG